MNKLKVINVTQRDINKAIQQRKAGRFNLYRQCPIAQSLIRTLKLSPRKKLEVRYLAIHFAGGFYYTTPEMQDFIKNFDDRKEVQPAKFILDEKQNY